MAKTKTKNKAQRQAELATAMAERRIEEAQPMQNATPTVPELPEGVTLVDLNNPKEAHNAIAEAVGEPLVENEEEEEKKASSSVVAAKFKDRYIANARELGVKGKAARRSNWDWLAQEIAKVCLTEKQKIDIDRFLSVLDANEVDHSKWTNRARGWEGRLRMTGRVALQRIVADRKLLRLPEVDGKAVELVPPDDFVNKYKTKE